MFETESKKTGLKGLVKRREIDLARTELVTFEPLREGGGLPLLARPAVAGTDLAAWLEGHREPVGRQLCEHGGILFRGFGVRTPEELERLVRGLSGEPLEYTFRSTPRSQVRGEIYTSTEYPADQSIPLHNEMSYTSSWPLKIFFCCATPAPEGGETPIADSRAVLRRLDPRVRERFERTGVMYVRNYGEGIDLPWREVFQTDSRAAVDAFCRSAGLELEWLGEDRLRTRQVCQAVAAHPSSGERLWFNQAHLFHVTSLPAEILEPLLATVAEADLPRNTYYGDGSPIEADVLAEIRAAYREESVAFAWQEGDVLLLDNMLTAHGRRPYRGTRKVLVGMAEPWSAQEAAA